MVKWPIKIPQIPPIPPEYEEAVKNAIPENAPPINIPVGCGDLNLQMKAVNASLTELRKATGAMAKVHKLQATVNKAAMLLSEAPNCLEAAELLAADPAGTILIAAELAGEPIIQTIIDQLPSGIDEVDLVLKPLTELLDAVPYGAIDGIAGFNVNNIPAAQAVTRLAECKSKSVKLGTGITGPWPS